MDAQRAWGSSDPSRLAPQREACNRDPRCPASQEFTAVYRLHPLLPEYIVMRGADNSTKEKVNMTDLVFAGARNALVTGC